MMALAVNPLYNPLLIPVTRGEIAYVSGSSSSSSSSVPIRSRRSNRSSGDESIVVQPDGFVEEDLRAGGPHLPEEPCSTVRFNFSGYREWSDRLSHEMRNEIRAIGRRYDFDITEIELCCRQSTFSGSPPPQKAALIVLRRENPAERGWIHVARDVYAFLQREGIDDVVVEIIDPNFSRRPQMFSCLPTDEIFPMWPDLTNSFITILDLQDINAISCYRIGDSVRQVECPVTVLLSVNRTSGRDWKVLREEVVAILVRFGLENVGVLIRKDSRILDVGNDSSARSKPLRERPTPGESITPAAMEKGHGTLGGWLELQQPETKEWIPFALTCCHCCLPDEDFWSPEDRLAIKKWSREGVSFSTTQPQLAMNSPSQQDGTAHIEYLESQIEALRKNPDYCRVASAIAADEFVIPSDLARYRATEKILDILVPRHLQAKSFLNDPGLGLGTVAAVSGLRHRPSKTINAVSSSTLPSILDWGLVKPYGTHRIGMNTIPEGTLPSLNELEMRFFESLNPSSIDTQLHKIGRATGHTCGHWGNLKEVHIATEMRDGQEHKVITTEMSMVSVSRDFVTVARGDFGSLVFTINGGVVGLLFGGNDIGDIGYFTPIEDVITHIKETTGALDVRLRGGFEGLS